MATSRRHAILCCVFNLARCAAVYPFNTQIKDLDKGARLPLIIRRWHNAASLHARQLKIGSLKPFHAASLAFQAA